MHTTPNTQQPKRILMLVANPSISPVTGWPIGFWWSEVSHPFAVFQEAGCQITLASVEGGDLQADAYSDPEHESGYSADDFISLGFKHSPKHSQLLKQTPALDTLDLNGFDGIFVAGGQSPMVTFANNAALQQKLVNYYENHKPLALICHATCMLLQMRLSSGSLLVKGKRWTGFADSEEAFAEQAIGGKIQPFWIETQARQLTNTSFEVGAAFKPHAIADGCLITGQQQHSGSLAARMLLQKLDESTISQGNG